jgi:hypothetical protein
MELEDEPLIVQVIVVGVGGIAVCLLGGYCALSAT